MQPRSSLRLLAIVGTLGLLLLASLPMPVQAQDASVWATSFVPTAGAGVDAVATATDGTRLALAWRDSTTLNVHFMIKATSAASWVEKNADMTGSDAPVAPSLVHIPGTDDWIMSGRLTAGTQGLNFWRSLDDGATWTKNAGTNPSTSATVNGHFIPREDGTPGELALTYWTGTNDVFFRVSTDYGDTWSSASDISDNSGSAAASTASIQGAGGFVVDYPLGDGQVSGGVISGGPQVGFIGGDGSKDEYFVGSGGGFWSVPYDSQLSTTRDPDTTICAGTTGDFIAPYYWFASAYDPAVGNNFVCVLGANQAVPSASPTNAISLRNGSNKGFISFKPSDQDGEGQALLAYTDLTANNNYIWYSPDAGTTPYSQVFVATGADSVIYSVEQTDTMGYYVFVDNALGGALELAQSSVFVSPTPGEGEQTSWCSNPAILNSGGDPDADFGFNYVEQATFESDTGDELDDEVETELEDAYRFSSESDDYAFAGKGWDGNQATKSVFRIEAAVENHDSNFRSVFSFLPDTPSSTSKGTGSTAGDTSGSFEQHIAARFVENGNDWQIRLEYNSDSGDDGSPNVIGATANTGNPNSPTTYWFTVDTRSPGYAAITDDEGNDIVNQTMVGNPATFFASLADDTIYSHWFVSSGSNTVFNSITFLDDNEDSGQTDDSTCLFFLDAPVEVEGDQGTIPGSVLPPEDDDDTTDDEAENIFAPLITSASNLFGGNPVFGGIFVSILFILGFGGIGYGAFGGSLVGTLVGAGCGLVLSLALGIFPLWPILVLVVLGVAFIFFKARG